MSTKLLYLEDSYLKEYNASIVEIAENSIVLDQTIFYAKGGGQPADYGFILKGNVKYQVLDVVKKDDQVYHFLDKVDNLKIGDNVLMQLDWERRFKLMQMHTSAHIVSEIIHKKTGAMITGNQLDLDKSRIDFSLENYKPEEIKTYFDDINIIIKKNLEIKAYFKKKEDIDFDLTKLAKGLPDSLKILRIVEITNFDKQADGGTHVSNTSQIHKISFLKAENKGKNNRRLYFIVE